MQSIERYGVVALLFLVVTVVAVIVWDGDTANPALASGSSARAAVPVPRSDINATEPEHVVGSKADHPPEPGTEPAPATGDRWALTAKPTARPISRERWDRELLADPPRQSEPEVAELDSTVAKTLSRDLLDPEPAPAVDRGSGLVDTAVPKARRRADEPTALPAGRRIYSVGPGDTLSEISQAELGTYRRWKEIIELNPGLDPARLYVGQKIVLPGEPGAHVARSDDRDAQRDAKTGSPARAPASAPAGKETYRVKGGDSLWAIAEARLGTGGRWREIVALNPGMNPDALVVGAVLELPSGQSPRTPQPVVARNDAGSGVRGKVR